ncbi:DegV family protein [Aerococcaceae bacterium WGS1372]
MKYIITTESGSDIPKDLVEKYNIHVIPMHVTMGDKTYPDGSFEVEKVYKYYEKTNELPKTSGSTPNDNSQVFQKIFDKYPDAHIIHIAYSSVTTVSFNSARIASEEFEHITLIDSKNVTAGLTMIIKATAEYIEDHPGATPEDIVSYVENIRERTRFFFMPKTLLYLKAGGRVSTLAFFGANLLNIQPTVVLEDGYLVAGKKYRGSFERSLKKALTNFFTTYDIDPETVILGGSPGVDPAHKQLVLDIASSYGVKDARWMDTGAVISSHSGPGAIGWGGIERA